MLQRLALVVALTIAVAIHVGLAVYLWTARFEPHYRALGDEVTDVQLIKPRPPPVPPPTPPKPKRAPPPKPRAHPRVQPRPPKLLDIPTIPPLPIPPAPVHLEIKAPPVIAPPAPKPAPPAPPKPHIIANPDWLQKPTGDEIARYYPDRAARLGIQGRAVIGCVVSAEGLLKACSVESETPDDEGFGVAAIKMSHAFKMRPMTRDGTPVEGATIRIPIRFTLAG